jgi:hypothetical protein
MNLDFEYYLLFYKTRFPNEEVNRTELSFSVSILCNDLFSDLILKNNQFKKN